MARQELLWWQKPLRIIRYDPLNDFSDFMVDDLAEHARETRRVCHANCEWVMANGGSSPGTASTVNFDSDLFEKNPTLGSRDILRDYLPHARKEGIHIIAYVNLHWFSYEFADEHPGWEQALSDGSSYGRKNPLYGNGTTMCINSDWREWAFGLLREVMTTGVDGAVLDGPVVFPGACYCAECKKQYRAKYDAEPSAIETWDEAWRNWVDFREASMERFLEGARQAIRSVNPGGIVYCNAGGYQLSTRVARNPWRLEPHQDMTGAEVFVHFGASDEDWLDTAIMAKYLSAGVNPAIVFSDHALGGWHYTGMTPVELKREFYQTTAGGASPWIATFTPALEHQKEKTLAVVEESWSYLESVEEYLEDDRSIARIAVLRSGATALSYISRVEALKTEIGASREQDLIASSDTARKEELVALKRFCEELSVEEFRGWCYLLTRQHLPYTVIRDVDCTADALSKFDCLVLPGAACMDDAALGEVRRFLDVGGTVVSTFETGWYDATGGLRSAGTGGVGVPVPAELVAFVPASFEEYGIIEGRKPRQSDTDATAPDFELSGFDEGELVPRPAYALCVAPSAADQVLARYLEPIGYHYKPPRGVSDFAMAAGGRHGAGKWIYFSWLPGAEWRKYRVPQWERLATGAIRSLLGNRVQLETDAPATVQIELREQPGRIVLHIVNNSGDNQFPPSAILPVGPFNVSILCEEPNRVFDAPAGDMYFDYENGSVRLRLDMQDQYRIIIISYE